MGRITLKKVLAVFCALLIGSVFICNQVFATPTQDPGSWTPTRDNLRTNQGNLTNHGGSVALNNTTYTIFWQPNTYTYSPHYQQFINRFLSDVAADSGKSTNVYSSTTQYGPPYASTFGGSVLDTNPFPTNGCTNPNTAICLTDTQVQAEITRILGVQGWSGGINKIFLLFTPANVGSCFDSGLKCSYQDYCAYHSYFGGINTPTLYANIAYPTWKPAKCDNYQHPNGDAGADAAINLVSNEHNQMLSDPTRNGWYDSISYEQAEKCAWNFGTSLGWGIYGRYNQVINGHQYYLQQQWSNRSGRCVLTGS